MPRDTDSLLQDMREAAERARSHIAGYSREEFLNDGKTIDAIVRCLTIVGEAAKQVPKADRDAMPSLPWREMTGLRDRVVHDYLGLDLDIIWRVVTEFLPPLIDLLPELSND